MTTNDDATVISLGLMVILGIPCILLTAPAIFLGLSGDWSLAHRLIEWKVHWVSLFTILLIIVILIAGDVLK